MKIYDCFTFYNELELLDLRLAEMYDHVDHMVLVEANTTFTNIPKSFTFEQNLDRYSQYLDKIIHVKVEDMPCTTDPWDNEIHQRNAIDRGLSAAQDDDIVIISDIDEIMRSTALQTLRSDHENDIWGLRMPLFNFTFNHMLVTADYYSVWGMAARRRVLPAADDFRRARLNLNHFSYNYSHNRLRIIEHAGWHFTYLGDTEFARNKIRSFAHQESNRPEILDNIDIDSALRNGFGVVDDPNYRFENVLIDQYMPHSVQINKDKYQKYIAANAIRSAADILPK